MIRYNGIHEAKNHKFQSYINKMFKLSEIRELKAKRDWRNMLISTFKFDPLVCDLYGHMMKIKLTCIPIYERRINGMISNTQNPKKLNQPIKNTLQDTVQQDIDEKTKYVIEYFKANNIPFHMENGISIREDSPNTIEMNCKRCNKKHDMPYNIYMETLEYADPFEEMEFIVIEYVYCHKGDMLPIKYLNKK